MLLQISSVVPSATPADVLKVFRISLLLNYTMDLVPVWYHDRYWSKGFNSTISTHDRDLEVEVTDLEFKCYNFP